MFELRIQLHGGLDAFAYYNTAASRVLGYAQPHWYETNALGTHLLGERPEDFVVFLL